MTGNINCLHAQYDSDSGGRNLPGGIQGLTSWGQRDCLFFALPLTSDKPPPARTADVLRGWRGGWRKAPRGSPFKTGSATKIKTCV